MFHTIKQGTLEYLTADALTGSIHCFSTRYGGVSTGDFASLNLGSNRGDPQENVAENYRRVAAFFGVGRDDCAVTKQVHGNEVRVVTGADKHVCGSRSCATRSTASLPRCTAAGAARSRISSA